jgi:hypothetical protein
VLQSTLSMPLLSNLSSPALARSRVTTSVEPWGSVGLVSDLRLLVSEVVANAVVHGGADICLELYVLRAYAVRIEVFDSSLQLPELQFGTPPGSESGRGLQLVDALASRWGARHRGDGKVVWFELHDTDGLDLRIREPSPRAQRITALEALPDALGRGRHDLP